MSVLVSFALVYTLTDTLFWDVPGDVLEATIWPLSLQLRFLGARDKFHPSRFTPTCGWKGVVLSLSPSLSLSVSEGIGTALVLPWV